MNLTIINQDGKLVVSSRQIAEHFEKQHKHVLEKIDNLLKEMGSAEKSAQYFIPSEYRDSSGKANRENLLTRDGFTLLAMGFTGTKALEWKLKYIEAFNKMEQQLSNPYQNLSIEMKALLMHDEKLVVIDTRVSKLENEMTVDYGQKKELRDLGNKRVMKVLGGKHTLAYKHFSKTAFHEIWKHYKNCMNINSYENTAVKEFERGKEILRNWQPSKELEYAILGANTQSAVVVGG